MVGYAAWEPVILSIDDSEGFPSKACPVTPAYAISGPQRHDNRHGPSVHISAAWVH